MQKVSNLILLALSSLIVIPGCQKIEKYLPHPPKNDPACVITAVTQALEGNERHGIVYSNAQGRPDSVIFDIELGSAGASYFYFTYDAGGKLTGYNGNYTREEGDYYFRHKYVYAGNRIVQDTAFIREGGSYTEVLNITYDNAGRVIKEERETIESDGQPASEVRDPLTYAYNAQGNLVSDYADYDDKVNFLRTNKVWQFIQRDYSQNNPATSTGYNSNKLPTGFNAGYTSFLQQSLPVHIEYACQ